MEKEIKDFVEQQGHIYIPIDNKNSLQIIYDMVINSSFTWDDFDDSVIYYYLGTMFEIANETELAFECYQQCAYFGNSYGFYSVGTMYRYYEEYRDDDKMLEYYTIACEKGNMYAAISLGDHYFKMNQMEEAKKYYQIASKNDNVIALTRFAEYYFLLDDHENMIECLTIPLEKNYHIALRLLSAFYFEINEYKNAVKYYVMAAQNGNETCIRGLNYNLEDDFYFDIADAIHGNLSKSNFIGWALLTDKTQLDDCPICLENGELLILYCGHMLCYFCLERFIEFKINKCHFCRRYIYRDLLD